jgi:hypothetical protein
MPASTPDCHIVATRATRHRNSCLTPLNFVQLSLAALVAVPKLPVETLSWLTNPDNADNFDTSSIPGLNDWNYTLFLGIFADMFGGIAAVNGLHDIGHAVVVRSSYPTSTSRSLCGWVWLLSDVYLCMPGSPVCPCAKLTF